MVRGPSGSLTDVNARPPRGRGRPRRTDGERAAQRAELVEGAIAAIRAGGADLSMDDLAGRIGVSKPVLYAEFGGKVGIADAIAVVMLEQVERSVFSDVAVSGPDPLEHLVRRVIDRLVSLIEQEPEVYAFVVSSALHSGRGMLDNALVRGLHARSSLVLGTVAALPVDADELSVLLDGLYGFVLGAIESWQSSGSPPRQVVVDSLTTVITVAMRGLVASR